MPSRCRRLENSMVIRPRAAPLILTGAPSASPRRWARLSKADGRAAPGGRRASAGRADGGTGAEQAERLVDGDPAAAEAGRRLVLGEPELIDQALDTMSLLDRVQVLPLEVLDQAQEQALVVG